MYGSSIPFLNHFKSSELVRAHWKDWINISADAERRNVHSGTSRKPEAFIGIDDL